MTKSLHAFFFFQCLQINELNIQQQRTTEFGPKKEGYNKQKSLNEGNRRQTIGRMNKTKNWLLGKTEKRDKTDKNLTHGSDL